MHGKFFLLSLLLVLGSSAHAAEYTMRPGLWEMTTTSNLLSLIGEIPPDQVQNLNNIARQYGFDMPKIKNGAANSKVCITKEMAHQKIPPSLYDRQSGCEARNATQIENRYTADLVCTGEQISGQGKADATLNTAESFTGQTEFKGLVRGVAVDEHAHTSGHWISPYCEAGKEP